MKNTQNLTEGKILPSLLRFAVPVLFTLFLQALYGGVDLLVVGQFGSTEDVSGVATGSMLLQTATMIVTGLSMGVTISVGEKIGMRKPRARPWPPWRRRRSACLFRSSSYGEKERCRLNFLGNLSALIKKSSRRS